MEILPPVKASEPEKETVSTIPPSPIVFPCSMKTFVDTVTCANVGPSTMHPAHRSSEQNSHVRMSPRVIASKADEGASRGFGVFLRSQWNISPAPTITNHHTKIDNIPPPRFVLPEAAAMDRYSKKNEIAIQEYLARENAYQQCGHARVDDDDGNASAVHDHVYPPFDPASCMNMAFENSPQGHQLASLYKDLAAASLEAELPPLTTAYADHAKSINAVPFGYFEHGPSVFDPVPQDIMQTMLLQRMGAVSSQAGLVAPITHISPGNSLLTNFSNSSWASPTTSSDCDYVSSPESPVMVTSNPATPDSFVSVASDHLSFVSVSPDDGPAMPPCMQSSAARRSIAVHSASPVSRGRSDSPMFPMNNVVSTEPAKTPPRPPQLRLRVRNEAPIAKSLEQSIRKLETDLIVQARSQGMSYKEIKKLSNFKISESTLRGRVRNATLPYKDRVRKPVWTEDDKTLVLVAVNRHFLEGAYGVSARSSRPPWQKVADWMYENGASYNFSGRACHKMWSKLTSL